MRNAIRVTLCAFGLIAGVASAQERPPNPDDPDEPVEVDDEVGDDSFARLVADVQESRRAEEVAQKLSDAEIAKLVRELFDPVDRHFAILVLRCTGARAVPHLIAALDDVPAASASLGTGHERGVGTAIERICVILDVTTPPEAAAKLARFADHADPRVRGSVAAVLGSIGTEECIEPVVLALGDAVDEVSFRAVEGIASAVSHDRACAEFRDAVFLGIASQLSRADASGDDAPRVLLEIDETRALTILTSHRVLDAQNENVVNILNVLNDAELEVPHDVLLPLLAELRRQREDAPGEEAYASALTSYVRNPDANTEIVLTEALTAMSSIVTTSAASGLAILAGVESAGDVIDVIVESDGFDALTKPQQLYFAVKCYDAEVRRESHGTYFWRADGDRWPIVREGLTAIGATETASIFEAATTAFGANGPALKHLERQLQLSGVGGDAQKILRAADVRYADREEDLEVLLTVYAAQHKDAFTGDEN